MEEKEKAEDLMTNIIKPKTDTLKYGFKVLSNGLKVLLISDPDTLKSSAALGVNIGSLVDKKDEQGLAHFCEHLLFMGTKKYPSENDYREYISKNGGLSNAGTQSDRTIYYFDVSNEALEGALDRFAEFFISSTFNEGSVEREIKAVDNEFSNNLNNDGRRAHQIKASEMNKDSPFNKFSTGNLKTLSLPDIRDRLLVFYKKYYSSDIMTLCVYSNKSLEDLLKLVEGLFSPIPRIENFKLPRYDEVKPFIEDNQKMFYKIVPIKNVNELQLEWNFPFCEDYYTKPLGYLSYVLGHEGPNTLTSALNKDNLCNSLTAGSGRYSKTYMILSITITLTKKGLENYREVILRTLKYVKTIKEKGINKRYYEEEKQIGQVNFDFKQKLTPINCTKTYASNLMDYKPEDIIAGPHLFGEFNESLIKQYLDMMTLDNLNIILLSNSIAKDCNLTEEIYGTKYSKEKFDITEEEVNSYKCDHIFDYPPENTFIPKNFDILPAPKEIGKYPEKIIDKTNLKVWYLQDTIFNKPKTYLVCQFTTPEDLCDFSEIKLRIMSTLLDKIITVELGEFLYMAESASVNIQFAFGVDNSCIIFDGYSDSLKKGMKDIFSHIKNTDINTQRCRETLELQQKDMLIRARNIFFNSNYQVNLQNINGLLNSSYKNPEDIINFFSEGKKITIEDLIIYKNQMFKSSKIKWLIQGNVSKEEALSIVEETNKILEIDVEKEKIGKFYINRPVYIKKNCNYIYRKKCINPKDENSSLISIYQTDILNDKEFQYLKLIESFLKEEFFDQLRTKETLGYIVSLIAIETKGYFAIANVVQSNSKTPEYCATRVRNFYKNCYQKVKDISEEVLKSLITAQLNIVSKKDNNLSEVFLRNWSEINSDTYKFDRNEIAKKNLNECNKEEFVKFYEKYFINEVAIVDSEYVSTKHYEQNEKEVKETTVTEGENIKKRIICDSFEDFQACNYLGIIYNNPVFMANKD